MLQLETESLAPYFFHQGTNFCSYKYLGVHSIQNDNFYEYSFRVWAPNAEYVSLTGDFNSWDTSCRMEKVTEKGIWEFILKSDAKLEGCCYKYYICGKNGEHFKSDPYAIYGETLSRSASYVYDLPTFDWNDEGWLNYRKTLFENGSECFYPYPLNIYEMHLGSWKTREGKSNVDGNSYLTYREIALDLVKYVKHMGYTHVELLPIAEHPFDGSWGYQVCGYYAPTSRYGSPEDFMFFVDTLHQNGIGVILDWVPAHFPKDEHGLYEFDGGRLYEYQGDDRLEHKGWGTRCFDVGRNEVQSFLISNALYWMREYHIDGLRVDAVASMLYLDYDRKPGEWIPSVNGDNKNIEAIAFFQKLNTAIFAEFPDVLMIAEESTAWPKITHPVSEGGLGFNFKWNMGWSNDSFEYISLDPYFRQYNHNKLTFPIMYTYSENYILPVSHDEVVHGKKSLLDKCFGEYNEKFATVRAFMTYMMTFPGKKLMFMGQEYGQFREWDYKNQLEWFMKDYEMHRKLSDFTSELNNFYLSRSELWEFDLSEKGFKWVYPDLAGWNTIVYRRIDSKCRELLVCINFSSLARRDFEIDVDSSRYKVVFSTDMPEYGGSGFLKYREYSSLIINNAQRIKLDIPALSAVILEPIDRKEQKQ